MYNTVRSVIIWRNGDFILGHKTMVTFKMTRSLTTFFSSVQCCIPIYVSAVFILSELWCLILNLL